MEWLMLAAGLSLFFWGAGLVNGKDDDKSDCHLRKKLKDRRQNAGVALFLGGSAILLLSGWSTVLWVLLLIGSLGAIPSYVRGEGADDDLVGVLIGCFIGVGCLWYQYPYDSFRGRIRPITDYASRVRFDYEAGAFRLAPAEAADVEP